MDIAMQENNAFAEMNRTRITDRFGKREKKKDDCHLSPSDTTQRQSKIITTEDGQTRAASMPDRTK